MSINSEIRKIAKAWGVDTKGSSIKDALKDLRTNLPFGTKTEMVEILNDYNLLCARARNGLCEVLGLSKENIGITGDEFIKPNTVYDVIFGGTKYTVTAIKGVNGFSSDEDTVYIGAYDNTFEDGKTPFNITFLEGTERFYFWWPESLGKSVKVSINKAEIVEPIDYKFMPEGYPKVETEMVEIVSEQSVTKLNGWDDFLQSDQIPIDNIVIDSAKEYTVSFNGKKYKCMPIVNEEEPDAYILGDAELGGEDLFSIEIYGDEYVAIWKNSEGETITLAIYEEQEAVKQLDSKFVGGVVFRIVNDGSDVVCDMSYNELLNIYKNNRAMFGNAIAIEENNDSELTFTNFWCMESMSYNNETGSFGFTIKNVQGNYNMFFNYHSDGTIEIPEGDS